MLKAAADDGEENRVAAASLSVRHHRHLQCVGVVASHRRIQLMRCGDGHHHPSHLAARLANGLKKSVDLLRRPLLSQGFKIWLQARVFD
jgi:hypothetical protein